MVHFGKDTLTLEIPCDSESPVETYYNTVLALTEILWFALDNDEGNDLIRRESALLTYNLLRPLLTVSKETKNQIQPKH